MHLCRLRLCLLPLLCIGMASAPARGAEAIPKLDAPKALAPLLTRHAEVLKRPVELGTEGARARLRRQAERELSGLLATEGYFSPRIELIARDDVWVILVTPGERARITRVDLELRGEVATPAWKDRFDALRAAWSLREGMPFTQSAWDGAKTAALRALRERDFAAAQLVDSRAEVDPDQATVALTVVLDSGPPFRLGQLHIAGLTRYETALVERYSRLEPGTRYDAERLFELQRALQSTPYFSSVTVEVDTDPAKAAAAPVTVQVQEARTKHVGLGAGYSSNTGARGEITYSDVNLFGSAWQFGSGLRLEQRRQLIYGDVFLPPTQKDYRDGFGALYERSDIAGLRLSRSALGAVRSRVKGRVEVRWALQFEQEHIREEELSRLGRRALSLNYSWTYRNVDNPLDPRRGYTLNLQAGGGAKALLSTQNFTRGIVRAQVFWPVGERDVVTARGEVGYTATPGLLDVPQSWLFRTGGAQSVRGYAYQSLGVKRDGTTVGGRVLGVASLEYTHWFGGDWGMAAFVDTGNATDSWQDFKLVTGYGLGARWRSPAGPLAFDLAWGERDRKLRPHFSVAIAF